MICNQLYIKNFSSLAGIRAGVAVARVIICNLSNSLETSHITGVDQKTQQWLPCLACCPNY
ncbi:MAG: hypothetical protein AVDCRST_MAG96-769 [uncultured Segetibacter sp.]|uniref:Uncharacterized protein n=1 Tax=uncultured Segetibacter sp. TaxID=481133 RepID=A0A6J4RTE6_9BACT|nr:MAG: hypothetical protein AVDCRST_MAG96-769 [uncultured Segetibacter sp.]